MKIQKVSSNYYQSPRPLSYTTAFEGILSQKTLANTNIGNLPDGIIGKIRVLDNHGKNVFFDVVKWVEYTGLEHYSIQNKKKDVLANIQFIPVITEDSKHILVKHLVNHASRYHKYRTATLGDFNGIGTRLMQIALQRSKETGCDGNVEAFVIDSAHDFYKKIGMEDCPDYNFYEKQFKMYLPEESKEPLSKLYGGL